MPKLQIQQKNVDSPDILHLTTHYAGLTEVYVSLLVLFKGKQERQTWIYFYPVICLNIIIVLDFQQIT